MIKNKKYDIILHASNVAGLGSSNVVLNLLKSLSNKQIFTTKKVKLYLPDNEFWRTNSIFIQKWNIIFIKRFNNKYFRLLSRFFNVLFSNLFISKSKEIYILGDFPIRTKTRQILLLHNSHLVKSIYKIDKFFFHRLLFRFNHRFVDKCIVQTELIKKNLIKNYPHFDNITSTILMPANELFENKISITYDYNKINLFYPASFYKHKNHKIINSVLKSNNFTKISNIKFTLTINKSDWLNISTLQVSFLKNIDFVETLNVNQVFEYYKKCGVLFFPSTDETFGLPLVEAMKLGLFVICSDLPYARLLCGDEAIYFDPHNEDSLINSILELKYKIKNKIYPNWEIALSNIPKNWNIYTDIFLDESLI